MNERMNQVLDMSSDKDFLNVLYTVAFAFDKPNKSPSRALIGIVALIKFLFTPGRFGGAMYLARRKKDTI